MIKKPSAEAFKITLIRFNQIGWMQAQDFFDAYGLLRDEHYVLFSTLRDETFGHFHPGSPQLVFTDHISLNFEAGEIAERIKKMNPEAIVFGMFFASDHVKQPEFLDGVIDINNERTFNVPSLIAQAFLEGKPRKYLLSLLRK